MRAFAVVSLLATAALAVPLPLKLAYESLAKRNCNPMPDHVDPNVRDSIYKIVMGQADTDNVKQSGGVDRVMLITMVTAYTESMINNLNCGDKDSLDPFQQRPSQNWGSPQQLMDINYSTNAFLNALYPLAKSHPDTPPGTMAQMVQNAEAGDQYTKNVGTAEQIIKDAAASVGDSKPDPKPSKPTSTEAPTSTETPAPKPTSGNDGGNGATNVGSAPGSGSGNDNSSGDDNNDDGDDSDCDDDNNDDDSGNDDECDPSDSGDDSSSNDDGSNSGSSNASTGVPSTSTPSQFTCTKTYKPNAGDNCYFLSGKFGIKLSDVYAWNSNIDSECLNLQIGVDYCVGISQ